MMEQPLCYMLSSTTYRLVQWQVSIFVGENGVCKAFLLLNLVSARKTSAMVLSKHVKIVEWYYIYFE